ncbi:hypothetical protein diail_7221 [Diaporthe ilicicola]|nr:hypothetical protein diail_7221 [Diaporthe ilicicola]
MPFAIGIDIGTANTRVAVFRGGKVEIIPDEDGNELMPSYVAFGETCRLFGCAAKAQAESNSKNTIYGIKPFLSNANGLRMERRLQRAEESEVKSLPYLIKRSDNRGFIVKAQYKGHFQRFTPVELLAMLLAKAKTNAEAYLSETVGQAVISVPVDFNSEQRHHMRAAAEVAGLEVLRICTGIESIALHMYAADKRHGPGPHCAHNGDKTVAIIDRGANFFNIGVALFSHGAVQILAQDGGRWQGGDHLARYITARLYNQIHAQYHVNHRDAPQLYRLAQAASEAAMLELTLTRSVPVRINTRGGKYGYTATITREDFENDLKQESLNCIDHNRMSYLICNAGIRKSDISKVVMVGGCSKIPYSLKFWKDYFGHTPVSLSSKADVSEVSGSAMYAAMLTGSVHSGSLGNLDISGCLPASIQIGPVRAKTVASKILGSLGPLVNDRTISALEKQKTDKVAYYCAAIPGKWSWTFPIRQLGISPSKPMIYIYEGHSDLSINNLLIGELDVQSLLSSSSLVKKIKIVIEVGMSLQDIQVTAESPEYGKSVQYVKRRFIDEEKVRVWRLSEIKYQQDDQAVAAQAVNISDPPPAYCSRAPTINNPTQRVKSYGANRESGGRSRTSPRE